jgi:hypothetical protein
MNKKNAPKIIAGLVALVGVYFIFKYLKDTKKPKEDKKDDTTPTTLPTPSTSIYPIKKGSKGSRVTELQKMLLKIDPTSLPKYGADGDFGSETEKALEKILGKKSVDSADDLIKLNTIYNRKKYPYVAAPETNPTQSTLPPFFGGGYNPR